VPTIIGWGCLYRGQVQGITMAHILDDLVQHCTHICKGIKHLTQMILRTKYGRKILIVCLKKQEQLKKEAIGHCKTPKAVAASNDKMMLQTSLPTVMEQRHDYSMMNDDSGKMTTEQVILPVSRLQQTIEERTALWLVYKGLTMINMKRSRKMK